MTPISVSTKNIISRFGPCTEQALTAAQKNSHDPEAIGNAQTACDAAYLAYHPEYPQSFSTK
jgi:hypothetical protein